LLILLSDIDGFYSGIPGKDESAERFDRIHDITPEIEAMAGDAGTELSKGGMVTKLEALPGLTHKKRLLPLVKNGLLAR